MLIRYIWVDIKTPPPDNQLFKTRFPAGPQLLTLAGIEEVVPGMPKKVMIIDDNDKVLRITELLIKSFGYSPIAINDPREGLKLISEDPPSLILLDLMMSPMDGSQFLDERRKIPGALEIPVMVCSAWRLTEEELAPYKDEVIGVIAKPVEPALLREILKDHLGA